MPIHDWIRIEAGIFHHFHHSLIGEIKRALNTGGLPDDRYAMVERLAAGLGPDVLTPLDLPNRITAQTDAEFYRRKKSSVAVRHVSDDRIVAMVEVVSPGNKAARNPFRSFVEKACALLEVGIHLLIVDPFPPTPRDPHGVHTAI